MAKITGEMSGFLRTMGLVGRKNLGGAAEKPKIREHCGERNTTPEQMRQPGSALTPVTASSAPAPLPPTPPRPDTHSTLELREVKKNFIKEFSKIEVKLT